MTEKSKSLRDLRQDIAGNQSRGTRESETAKKGISLLDGGLAEIDDGWSTVKIGVPCSREQKTQGGTIGCAGVEPSGSGKRIEPAPGAIGTWLSFSLLPSEPGFLDGIGAGTPVDIRHVKELTEPAAAWTPTLG